MPTCIPPTPQSHRPQAHPETPMRGRRGRYRGVAVDGYPTAEVVGAVQAAKRTVVPGILATEDPEAA